MEPQTNAGEHTEKNYCDFIEVIEYDPENYKTYTMKSTDLQGIEDLARIPENCVKWINIDGQCSEAVLQDMGKRFHLHPLVIKNIYNSNQRAKIEEYQGFLHMVAKMIYYADGRLVVEHMNLILGSNYVITFGETKGDIFEDIRTRLKSQGSHVRMAGADYLAYSLLATIVEGYFDVLETLNQKIDLVEEDVITTAAPEHFNAIRQINRDLLVVNKYIWPLRDVASIIGRETSKFICPSTEPYFRDVYNHIVQAIDSTETSRELLSGLMDLHMSNISYKLNEIMKVLTIISTLFIPLTFIVGVYGMNFRYMPELQFRWGYGITWVVMLFISGCMIYYFKKKKWF